MDLAELLALAVALSLPLWLAVEEVLHRLPARPKEAARLETKRTARTPVPVAGLKLSA